MVTDSSAWAGHTSPAFCYYKNTTNADSIKKYGALYNWYAIETKKLAPKGWHIPSDADWDTLQVFLSLHDYNLEGTSNGTSQDTLMNVQTSGATPSYSGSFANALSKNNKIGFSAIPGGCRYHGGKFYGVGRYYYWWISNEVDHSSAHYRAYDFQYVKINRGSSDKRCGFSVWLLKD
jgi:uncharacterized protein (TIGR02145 family)